MSMVSLLKRHDFATAGERSGLFTRLEARLIHAAMSSGSPAHMYGRLAECYTARAMQVATMKSRMVMPAGVFLLALIIEPLPGLASGAGLVRLPVSGASSAACCGGDVFRGTLVVVATGR